MVRRRLFRCAALAPVHDTLGEGVAATTEAAGEAVSDAKPDIRRTF